VRSLLEAAQAERATGTLTLRHNGAGATTLYFLFGHLFHALGEGAAGDDAVVSALAWADGDFDFDAKAKLPADETVRSSIPELIERSSATSAPRPAASPRSEATQRPAGSSRRSQTAAAAATPPPSPPQDAAWAPPDTASSTAPAPAFNSAAHQGAVAPGVPAAGAAAAPADAQRGQMTPAGWRRFFKQRPKPRHGREPVPVPAGQTMYESLKTSFVDFPRLITTLEREGHTGYVRLLTENANGLIYFREGTVLECVYDAGEDPNPELGKQALIHFNEEVGRGQGILDVVGLTPELVDGLFELTVAHPVYTELYASWVDVPALLRFLDERRLTGTLNVRSTAGTGVIILKEGKLAGAYTSESREVAERADGVLALCHDPGAMIEVKARTEMRHEPLDVGDIMAGRRPTYVAAAPVQAPPPMQAPPPAPVPTASAAPRPQAPAYTPPSAPTAPIFAPPTAPIAPAPVAAAPVASPYGTTTAVAPPSTSGAGDWEGAVSDLQQITEDQLGNRARKVKDLLGASERSRAGIQSAIDQIPTISILFVDASRLEALANDLRSRLEAYPG
jgi:hypothetical protein